MTFGLASPDALALALGRVSVQSALGEPLRAEIELPEISPEEVSSLKASIASPAQFRAAGVEFSPALSSVQITLQRRPNGSYFLHLASERPVNDPFVDVILEATWATGRVQRDFTLLLDPPSTRQQAPLQAQTAPSAQGVPARPAPTPGAAPAPAPSSRAAAPATPRAPRAAAPAPAPAPSGDGKQVTVQAGDTAGKLASASKPASVSLDQMLVAMLRANPDAFVDGNVNRLRAGTVLDMPSGEQAAVVPQSEARQTLVAQSRDFNEFRRRLAEGVPTATAPAAGRAATGRVQAEVEDKKAPAGPGDRLSLSKGAVQGRSASADQIARERQNREQASRVAELNKNLSELNKLAGTTPGAAAGTGARPAAGITAPPGVSAAQRGASAPATTTAAAPAATARPASAPAATAPATAAAARPASAPAAATPAPAAATAARPASAPTAAAPAATASVAAAAARPATSAPAAATASPAPAVTIAQAPAPAAATLPAATTASAPSTPAATAASAPVATASGPAAALAPAASGAVAAATPPVRRPAAPPPPPPPEPSLVDDLLENPLVPALVVGLLAVLAGFGFYKFRQKRKTAAVDSSFLESRLQPDSFFGASGGQRIDTAEANNPTGSSMVYSPSQLDAAGDVDPVAEADVYLAYGRDLQAEEILKEALRINPQRVAIHAKLLEIYAKRRDVKAFESVAGEAYNLTQGSGAEWEHICDLGRELDPSNPLYRPGGQPGAGAGVAAAGAAAVAGAAAAHAFTSTHPTTAQAAAAQDVDLDLDFSLGDEPETIQPEPLSPVMPPPGRPEPAAARAEPEPLNMDFSAPAPVPVLPPEPAPSLAEDNSLDFTPPPMPVATPPQAKAPAAAPDSGMLEFDLAGLSLDLPGTNDTAPAAPASPVVAPADDIDMPPLAFDLDQPSTQGPDLGAPAGGDADSPLATKLALAEEFNAIGDADGARSLAEEVVAEASGDLKSRAQRLLAEIG